jgi:predicted dehydrogenase
MLEKRAGDKMDEYRRLIDLAQRKHLHVQMIYLFRYMSAVQEMFACVRTGELGRIYEFRARLPRHPSSYTRFVEDLKPYRGGMFFEMTGYDGRLPCRAEARQRISWPSPHRAAIELHG